MFIARDADSFVLRSILEEAKARKLEIVEVDSMRELGKMCGIDVGTAVAVQTVLK